MDTDVEVGEGRLLLMLLPGREDHSEKSCPNRRWTVEFNICCGQD